VAGVVVGVALVAGGAVALGLVLANQPDQITVVPPR
jgi:hypothetical protein